MFLIDILMELLDTYIPCWNVQPLLVGLHFHLSWHPIWLLVTISPIFSLHRSYQRSLSSMKENTNRYKKGISSVLPSVPVQALRGATPMPHSIRIMSAFFIEIQALQKDVITYQNQWWCIRSYLSDQKELVEGFVILCRSLYFTSPP